jgi:predicted AAA+ superfamily ATPase
MQKIPLNQILKRIQAENIWWESPNSISALYRDYHPRAYLQLLKPLLKKWDPHRAIVLMGPRRVGKTVMIHHAIQDLLDDGVPPQNICYFSVDNPLYTGLGLEKFLEYYQKATEINSKSDKCYVFFDEIQYLRDWEVHLKVIVDSFKNIKCVVSGSAAAALRLKSIESGAGRFTNFLLPPLTFPEYLELLNQEHLIDKNNDADKFCASKNINELNKKFIHYINFGGYPEVIFSEEIQSDPGRFIKSDIVDKVLLRDLPGLYGIQDIQELNHLFTTLAFNTANEVSLDELSKGSGVAKNTIKRYIEYLEAAFLIKIVHRVDRNARRFKRAHFFKVYLTNPSIRTALFTQVEQGDEFIGHLAETAIFAQWFHSGHPLHYARWKGGEIDIVNIEHESENNWAVEVKWSDIFFDRPLDLKNVFQFCHANNLREIAVTTLTKCGKQTLNNVDINFVPTSLYCYTVGYNLLKAKKHRRLPKLRVKS